MLETVLQWDTSAMHWINQGWSHPIMDAIMPAFRNKYFWLPLYVLAISWIIYNFNWKQVGIALLFIALSVFATDTISSKLIKKWVERPRPCQVENMNPPVIQRISCGSGFSFTSSHSANHFGIASFVVVVFGSFLKKWRHLWWLWALLVSVAQVYVGVHYPLDIAAGAVLGIIVGLSMGTICKHYMKHAAYRR